MGGKGGNAEREWRAVRQPSLLLTIDLDKLNLALQVPQGRVGLVHGISKGSV